MNTNLAYQEEPREELLHGKIYMMSSSRMRWSSVTKTRYTGTVFTAHPTL